MLSINKKNLQITLSLLCLLVAGLIFWSNLRLVHRPPESAFLQGEKLFKEQNQANNAWFREADRRGLSYQMYIPKEIAATEMTAAMVRKIGKSPQWASMSPQQRGEIIRRINDESDAARQAMRMSNYSKPFAPAWSGE